MLCEFVYVIVYIAQLVQELRHHDYVKLCVFWYGSVSVQDVTRHASAGELGVELVHKRRITVYAFVSV